MKIIFQKIIMTFIILSFYCICGIPLMLFRKIKKGEGLIATLLMFWKEEVPIFGIEK